MIGKIDTALREAWNHRGSDNPKQHHRTGQPFPGLGKPGQDVPVESAQVACKAARRTDSVPAKGGGVMEGVLFRQADLSEIGENLLYVWVKPYLILPLGCSDEHTMKAVKFFMKRLEGVIA